MIKYAMRSLVHSRHPFRLNTIGERSRKISFEVLSSAPNLIQLIQTSLVSYQDATGLPWWLTFATSTALFRVTVFPLVRLQIVNMTELAKAFPDIRLLYGLFMQRRRLSDRLSLNESYQLLAVFMKGSRASLIVHNFSLFKFFLYPSVNIAAFVTFLYSLRNMVYSKTNDALTDGGISWFLDLTDKDPTFILPLTAVYLSYSGLLYSFSGNRSPIVRIMQDALQCLLLLGIPFYLQLPCGVFCYWIPSSIMSILQTKLLRTPYFQKLFRIPAPQKPPTATQSK
jgi:membrane protein insertase Oxa1/YidC/SpoIIIJ